MEVGERNIAGGLGIDPQLPEANWDLEAESSELGAWQF